MLEVSLLAGCTLLMRPNPLVAFRASEISGRLPPTNPAKKKLNVLATGVAKALTTPQITPKSHRIAPRMGTATAACVQELGLDCRNWNHDRCSQHRLLWPRLHRGTPESPAPLIGLELSTANLFLPQQEP